MLVIPAIDIAAGRVVRLVQGDRARRQVYGDDPVAWARRFQALGAAWLHVVDLDGAFEGRPVQLALVRAIASLGIAVQVGGGFRTAASIAAGLDAGAARVVVGTAARVLAGALGAFGDRVAVALDVRAGGLAVDGWRRVEPRGAASLAAELRRQGVRRFIYTAVERDGMLAGPDLAGLAAVVRRAGAPVIAAGGIAGPEDLEAVAATGVEGVIVGRALYEGRLALDEALARWSGG
jgi:phosphoribosylformimino-5-aminoimidazole carboxamide ribotide isomerase